MEVILFHCLYLACTSSSNGYLWWWAIRREDETVPVPVGRSLNFWPSILNINSINQIMPPIQDLYFAWAARWASRKRASSHLLNIVASAGVWTSNSSQVLRWILQLKYNLKTSAALKLRSGFDELKWCSKADAKRFVKLVRNQFGSVLPNHFQKHNPRSPLPTWFQKLVWNQFKNCFGTSFFSKLVWKQFLGKSLSKAQSPKSFAKPFSQTGLKPVQWNQTGLKPVFGLITFKSTLPEVLCQLV